MALLENLDTYKKSITSMKILQARLLLSMTSRNDSETNSRYRCDDNTTDDKGVQEMKVMGDDVSNKRKHL